jgi:acetylornithine deacetylase/succinyl-diaminopimelate desuccinylase-like protein
MGAKGAPTLLLYAHHDVQPPGRLEKWKSPPFTPTVRRGRLYGRGAADDKAGVMVHLAAVAAYLRGAGASPVNLKLIVEGEEEIGSEHLEVFLAKHRKMLAADCMVLTDTANIDTGVPSLTNRLRGIAVVMVNVSALREPLHSGMWGGPVPDPSLAMSKILASLLDAQGRVIVPGFHDGITPPSEGERARLAALPGNEAGFVRQARMLDGVELVGEPEYSIWERLWHRPALTVTNLEVGSFANPINQITESVRARIAARTVVGQDPAEVGRRIVEHVKAAAPWGVHVEATVEGTGGAWSCDAEGPAFEAARRALEKGYGRAEVTIGAGGSIPFVEPFARVLGGVPALLIGVEDPPVNAHAENESLCIADFRKAARASVHLYTELAGALGKA